eukprot:172519-Rhodomonas_salina.3
MRCRGLGLTQAFTWHRPTDSLPAQPGRHAPAPRGELGAGQRSGAREHSEARRGPARAHGARQGGVQGLAGAWLL